MVAVDPDTRNPKFARGRDVVIKAAGDVNPSRSPFRQVVKAAKMIERGFIGANVLRRYDEIERNGQRRSRAFKEIVIAIRQRRKFKTGAAQLAQLRGNVCKNGLFIPSIGEDVAVPRAQGKVDKFGSARQAFMQNIAIRAIRSAFELRFKTVIRRRQFFCAIAGDSVKNQRKSRLPAHQRPVTIERYPRIAHAKV